MNQDIVIPMYCDCPSGDCDKCHTCFGKDCDHSDEEFI